MGGGGVVEEEETRRGKSKCTSVQFDANQIDQAPAREISKERKGGDKSSGRQQNNKGMFASARYN